MTRRDELVDEQQDTHRKHERSCRPGGRLQEPSPLTAVRSSIAAARLPALSGRQHPRRPAWGPSTRAQRAPPLDRCAGHRSNHVAPRRACTKSSTGSHDGRSPPEHKWAQPRISGDSGSPGLGQLTPRSLAPRPLPQRYTTMGTTAHRGCRRRPGGHRARAEGCLDRQRPRRLDRSSAGPARDGLGRCRRVRRLPDRTCRARAPPRPTSPHRACSRRDRGRWRGAAYHRRGVRSRLD